MIDTEAVESRLDLGALSVSIPSDWTQEVRHFARCSELIAHPRTAAGPPPINLVVKWCVPSGTDVDQIVVDYLRLMGLVGSLEDLSVRCVTDRPEEAFRVSFLLRIAGQSVRQHSLILRAEQHDVSATITHKMEGAFRPYMIERCLSSITIAAP